MEKKNKIHAAIESLETQISNLPEEPETSDIKPILSTITWALKEVTARVEEIEDKWVDDYTHGY